LKIFAGLIFSIVFAANAAAQGVILSGEAARDIIGVEWNNLVGWLLIGERTVGKDAPPADCKAEQMNPAQFDFLLNAERAGLVTIRYWDNRGEFLKEKDYSNKEKIEFVLTGRLQKMTIIPTKEAQTEQIKLEVHNRTGCMSFKVGTYTIETVTGSRTFRKGSTELAEVSVNYRVDYAPIYSKVYIAGRIKIDNIRKANVLFRFDPSRKRWHTIAFDAANIGDEIKPIQIPAALEKIQ
jgi:hypothetical protein